MRNFLLDKYLKRYYNINGGNIQGHKKSPWYNFTIGNLKSKQKGMIFLNEITITNKGGKLTVSSLQVATNFGKRHCDVLESIENLKTENSVLKNMFIESTYKVEGNNKTYKCYDITRDGFSLLVMGFTGKKALDWKLKYIEAFNAMEQQFLNNNSLNVNLEELIAKTVTMSISETVKALIPLMKAPAQEIKELPSETKRIKKKYKHITPSKISML